MRTDDMRRSDNVEDRRGRSLGRRGAGIGIGTLVVVAVAYFMGADPATLLGMLQSAAPPAASDSAPAAAPPANDPQTDAVRAVLGETEDVWTAVFREHGAQGYPAPTLVLYSGSVESACGLSGAAAGPFYCPGDQKLYIDLAFFNELEQRFGAPGDFARAYVIAHEVGHHVQAVLGTTEVVEQARRRSSPEVANRTLVKLELQADCYAGIWANRAERAHRIMESGDLEEALGAAAAVGDDTLQRQAQGYVVPESFTHGTAAQRARWFRRGFERGQLDDCDTFNASSL
ncbi:MAG: neutral zinc metallopeptidase [Gammaproteobacteria bacterium]|nr:neutral zinc metallopeptidase [Gammaproteobacteria bacterium]